MSLELMKANLDLQARAEQVARQDPDALRKEALRAARDMDAVGLWLLVESFMVTRSPRGARVSAHTLHSYKQGLKTFLAWAGPAGMSLLRPKPNDGFSYIRFLEASQLAPESVKVRLAAGRALFAALRWAGATDAAPFTDVRAASDSMPKWEKRKPYPDEDIDTLLAAADTQTAVMIALGADCGLRNSEMTTLRRVDVHFDDRDPYIVVTGKRQKRQEVGLSRRAETALKRWMDATPSYGPFVLSIRTTRAVENAVRNLCDRAGVRYAGRQVHGLRHTAGTRTYTETSDIMAVRDLLRHRSIDSSEIYVNYARAGKKKVNRDW